MPRRLCLLLACLLASLAPWSALAQDEPAPELRYIEELKQRNADYGPGCNGIGISTPQVANFPQDVSTRWAAGHSACLPGLRLVASCLGEVVAEERLIGCTLLVADGQSAVTLGCERLTLLAPRARLHPDPALSDALSEGSGEAARSCAEAPALANGAAIAAAFHVPAADATGDLALMIDLDGSEVPAFLIPAGQLELATATP